MAKFFLFIFAILLSLSLGLFIGQSQPPPQVQNSTENKTGQEVTDAISEDLNQKLWRLKTHLFKYLESKIDQILANDFFRADSSPQILKNMDGAENRRKHKVVENFKENDNEDHEEENDNEDHDKELNKTPDHELSNQNKNLKAKKSKSLKAKRRKSKVRKPKVRKPKPKKVSIKKAQKVSSFIKTQWVVQLAAFKTQEEAQNFMDNLKVLNYPLNLDKPRRRGRTWYHQVTVGPFDSFKKAEYFRRQQNLSVQFKDSFVKKWK